MQIGAHLALQRHSLVDLRRKSGQVRRRYVAHLKMVWHSSMALSSGALRTASHLKGLRV